MNKIKSQDNLITSARFLGNVLSILGYVILLHYDPLIGSSVKLLGLILCMPFCVKLKLWDVGIVFGFFAGLDLTNIIKILFF